MVEAMQVPKGYKNTDVGIIPNEWNVQILKSLVFCHNAGVYKKKELYGTGCNIVGVSNLYEINYVGGQVFASVPLSEQELKLSSLKENDLLYGESSLVREGIARTIYVTAGGAGTAFAWHTRRYSVEQKKLLSRYLYYYLQSRPARKHMMDKCIQTALTGINTSEYFACPIPLPSIAEQTAVATALNDADALITGLEKLIAKKKAIKQGAMQELLKPKDGWEVKKLGQIADVTKLAGYEYSKYFNSYKDAGEIIVIRGTNITHNKLDLSDTKTIPRQISNNLLRSKLNKNDLVFAYVGTIGPVYLINEDDKYHLGPNTSKISAKKDITPQYLLKYFTSEYIKNEIIEYTSIGAQPSLSMAKIRKFRIAYPNTKEEQTRITQILSDMDAEIEALKKKLDKYKMLKQGMMQNLLTGRIRLI